MAATQPQVQLEQATEKGLKCGALGLISSTVIATASVAPAYSLAATLGFIVVAVGLKSPIIAILAFVPMILTSIGYSELNKADPDCGTTFTWATRAFSPSRGLGGRLGHRRRRRPGHGQPGPGRRAVHLPAVQRQRHRAQPGQRLGAAGRHPWIVVMTYICYRGIEVSANFQKALLGIEIVMLLVLSVTALVRVGTGHHPAASLTPSWSWLEPVRHARSARSPAG